MTFDVFRKRYETYAETYRLPDGTFPEGIQKKYDHTFEVVRYAETILGEEQFPEREAFLTRIAALFHDIYRFEEIRKFGTYDDRAAGIDHGHEGARLLWSGSFLDGLDAADQIAVTTAVELHNKKTVPAEAVAPLAERTLRAVRDADKISILGITYGFVSGKVPMKDKKLITLGRAQTGITPEIMENAIAGRPISYSDMRSKEDFIVTLFSWSADIFFPASARILLESRIYEKLAELLPDSPQKTVLTDKNRKRLECLSLK